MPFFLLIFPSLFVSPAVSAALAQAPRREAPLGDLPGAAVTWLNGWAPMGATVPLGDRSGISTSHGRLVFRWIVTPLDFASEESHGPQGSTRRACCWWRHAVAAPFFRQKNMARTGCHCEGNDHYFGKFDAYRTQVPFTITIKLRHARLQPNDPIRTCTHLPILREIVWCSASDFQVFDSAMGA